MMKRLLISAIALAFVVSCAACDVIETALLPTATPKATASPTQAPTPEPTAAPTPEPVFTETTLNSPLFTAKNVTVTAADVRFCENYMTAIDLTIENASNSAVTMQLGGVCLNRWQVDGTLENAANVAPGETRRSTVIVNFQDDPSAADLKLTYIAEMTFLLSLTDDFSSDTLLKQKSFVVAVPDAGPLGDPTQGTQLIYEDDNFTVYLQGIDGALQSTRVVLYHKPDSRWMGVDVFPVYAGYTNFPRRNYSLIAGKYRLITLDGAEVMARQSITALNKLELYLALQLFDGRTVGPMVVTITDPKVSETVMNTQDTSPIVYQSALPYCILRNKGIIEFEGHEAILLDLENTTQNNGTLLNVTASASNPEITIDGTPYPLMTYCTSTYPATHGYLLLWPDGAPEGTLSQATSATIGLRLSRVNGGKLEPILDTQDFSFDLK
ncbi:MAG TPA: hypothetical protein PKA81_14065 [Clostridia bacterium]|nr:hypothetical protein [Clostridia bacterium]